MGRRKIEIKRIEDERGRSATYGKRKMGLLKKAMELSVLCDCDVALVIFTSSGKLVQYSNKDMDQILERYSQAVREPHERRTTKDLQEFVCHRGVAAVTTPGGISNGGGGAAWAGAPGSADHHDGSPAASADSLGSLSDPEMPKTASTQDVLRPLGLLIDASMFPVSPRSEAAFATVTNEFDRLFEKLTRDKEDALTPAQLSDLRRHQQLMAAAGDGPSRKRRPSGTGTQPAPVLSPAAAAAPPPPAHPAASLSPTTAAPPAAAPAAAATAPSAASPRAKRRMVELGQGSSSAAVGASGAVVPVASCVEQQLANGREVGASPLALGAARHAPSQAPAPAGPSSPSPLASSNTTPLPPPAAGQPSACGAMHPPGASGGDMRPSSTANGQLAALGQWPGAPAGQLATAPGGLLPAGASPASPSAAPPTPAPPSAAPAGMSAALPTGLAPQLRAGLAPPPPAGLAPLPAMGMPLAAAMALGMPAAAAAMGLAQPPAPGLVQPPTLGLAAAPAAVRLPPATLLPPAAAQVGMQQQPQQPQAQHSLSELMNAALRDSDAVVGLDAAAVSAAALQ